MKDLKWLKVSKVNKYFKYIIVAISIAFIFIGIQRGEEGIVLQKAIKICLECIGVG